MTHATKILVWEDSEPTGDGDEVHVWYVGLADDNGDPVWDEFKHYSEQAAWDFATRMAHHHQLGVEIG